MNAVIIKCNVGRTSSKHYQELKQVLSCGIPSLSVFLMLIQSHTSVSNAELEATLNLSTDELERAFNELTRAHLISLTECNQKGGTVHE